MTTINVYFYTTSNKAKRASIIDNGRVLYMSEVEAQQHLAGKRYTEGPHTDSVKRRCGFQAS